MPMAVVFQFLPFYHIFHDLYGVHTEVCVGVMVALYAIIAWSGDRVNAPEARPSQQSKLNQIIDMWQSRVEIKGYSIAYFDLIAVFEAPYH